MISNPDYRATHANKLYQIQAQSETNLTLFRLKNDAQVSMELAGEVHIDEQKKIMTVNLKRSCGWSDGTMINAHHMLKGIEMYFELSKHPSPFKNLFKQTDSVLGIRAVDDFTLEFDLVSPPDLLMQALTSPAFTPAPVHLINKDPNSWPVRSIVRVSSGAFKAVSYEDDKKIEMVRNSYFCKGVPVNFDRVEFIGRKKHAAFVKDIILNMVDAVGEVNPEQVEHLTSRQSKYTEFTMGSYPGDSTVSLQMSGQSAALNNKKIRKAISLVMDYELINRVLSPGGKSHKNLGLSPPYPGYIKTEMSDSALDISLRIAKAKRLMKSLGYGPDNTLKLEILSGQEELFRKTQLVLVSKLSQIFIETTVNVASGAQYWDRVQKGSYDLLLLGWTADFHDPSNFIEGALSTLRLPPELTKKYDKDIKGTYSIYNKQQRMNELAKIEYSLLNSFYIIPLFRYQNYYLLKAGFKLLDEPTISARSTLNTNCKPAS